MSFLETIVALVPVLGLVLAIAAARRGRPAAGIAIFLAAAAFAGVVALQGNARPVAGFLAFSFLFASFFSGEKNREGLALACFSAAFIALIITAMYT